MFGDYANALHQRFPKVRITGEPYMPAPWKVQVSQICSMGFGAGILTVMAGPSILPEPYSTIIGNNRMAVGAAAFMMNVVGGQLLSTGAFEVSVDEIQVFSKIQEGRMPPLNELTALIGTALEDV